MVGGRSGESMAMTRGYSGPILVFKFPPNHRQTPSSTSRAYVNTPNVSQVG
jgi:hypothetical protein